MISKILKLNFETNKQGIGKTLKLNIILKQLKLKSIFRT